MGKLTQEMLEDNLIDSNELMQVSKCLLYKYKTIGEVVQLGYCLTFPPKLEKPL